MNENLQRRVYNHYWWWTLYENSINLQKNRYRRKDKRKPLEAILPFEDWINSPQGLAGIIFQSISDKAFSRFKEKCTMKSLVNARYEQ